ncbi:MAG: glycine oxidase ThiO [Terriglobia bacterium]
MMATGAGSEAVSDVIVVGGGLIGCAVALRLAQRKMRVQVFDRGEPGAEASSAGAGMIAPQGETVTPDVFYNLCAASRDLYPDFVAEVEELGRHAVDFHRDGCLVAALDERELSELENVYGVQARFGLAVEKLSRGQALRRLPQISPQVLGGLFFAGDYWLDNELLVSALYQACRKLGVIFHAHSAVARFNGHGDRVETIETEAEAGQTPAVYSAGQFVLAAGAWSGKFAGSLNLPLPVKPCRGQMVEFEGANHFPRPVRAGHFYCVPRSGGRLIAGSTMEDAGFDKAVTADGLLSILHGVRRLVPCVGGLRFRRAWAGFRPDTADHWPILGYGPWSNLVFATGHFRNGILLTPITAQLVAELIVSGSTSVDLHPYSPLRFQASACP